MAAAQVDLEEEGSPVSFRTLETGDLGEVKALHAVLFPVQYSDNFYNRLFSEGYFCLVGVLGGRIVAVASARCVETDGTPSNEAYIMTLGVDESCRRRRLGSRVMDLIIELLRERTECEFAVLHVKLLNEAAVGFYRRYGFVSNMADDYCRDHYYINQQWYDAARFAFPLRNTLMTLIKSYCNLL